MTSFLYSYKQNKSRLRNGLLLNLAILTTGILFGSIVLTINYQPLTITSFIIAGLLMVVVIFFSIFYGVFLIWNGIIVWQKESHSLANTLTLILGIMSILYPFVFGLIHWLLPEKIFIFFDNILSIILGYIILCLFSFLSSLLLFYFYRPKKDKDFIIVLGSGLINGNQVPPLLASRINRGIWFYQKQIKKGKTAPYIVCTGGQGSDESISEGEAMRHYAITHGVDAKHVIAETKAKNTIENMTFSKKIVDQLGLDVHNGIFVTSYYHLYRGAQYARDAGMAINGLGAKTKFFFVPNAIIREYIAVLLAHRNFHAIIVTGLVLFAIIKSLSQIL
ncbi:YdcF family protein [Holzapfeliella floricola]|uniref:Integral membrane protein n=1 Tax=Holzapfeliella floricola DSM 23037 = JCM 16512 TaxID=1423744 RepID=A0A0R2DJ58_9LACO|nr:YdcF family protein [Holzapfeliella floricola]KRN04110.1 integral membrane protein [Holzapfeliella floricola DSM 23037 = JCM 16512]